MLFFFSFIWTSTIVVVFIQHLEDSERRSVLPDPFLLVTSDSRPLLCHEFECPSTLPHHLVKLCLFFFVLYSLFFWAYKGSKVFSWVARIAYMERRVRSPISDSKLACGMEQGKGGGWGIGATNGIWWYPKRLNSRLSLPAHIKSIFIKRKQKTFFFHSFFFSQTSQGSKRAQLRTQISG